MNFQYKAALLLLAACPSLAQEAKEDAQPIDEIVVAGHPVTTNAVKIAVDQQMLVDTAMSLKNLPGADVNKNGIITGIAQYRGMYGDRVAVTIDSHTVVSGGPNAMDAPLSDTSHRFSLLTEIDNGDYVSTPAGMISPSAVSRNRYDASYAYTNGESHIVLFAGHLDTENSGTPALPMDINYIDTNLAGSHFLYGLSSNLTVDGRVAL